MPDEFPPLPAQAPPWPEPPSLWWLAAPLPLLVAGLLVCAVPLDGTGCIRPVHADARVIHAAAMIWMADNEGCPRLEDLELSPGARTWDAWDQPFVIRCAAEGPDVISIGRDGVLGSADDLRF